MLKRLPVALFGCLAYGAFLAVVLYGIGFIGNLFGPKTIDSRPAGSPAASLAIDLALIALFGLQHSVMARPGFKWLLVRFVPQSAERSIFVACTSLCLSLLFWQWRAVNAYLWNFTSAPVSVLFMGLYSAGWLIVIVSTFLIDHLDFTGLRQVFLYLAGREYEPVGFKRHLFYQIVRHPMMLGLLISFWAAAQMSLGHLIFSTGMTIYLLIGLAFEERDLLRSFGNAYQQYLQQVPKLIPMPRRSRAEPSLNSNSATSLRK